jgi:hypothetical protein
MPTFNQDRAAKALVDAILMGDQEAAKKYGVSLRTIENWRSRLDTDESFAAFFQDLRQAKDENWAVELPAALSSCINFLKEAGQLANRTDPDAIAAISSAADTLADIAMTQKVVDERLRAARAERAQAQ